LCEFTHAEGDRCRHRRRGRAGAIHFLKGYTVFNVEQIEGLPGEFYAPAEQPRLDPPQRVAHGKAFFAATKADISHCGSRAFYGPSTDSIVMPMFEAFRDAESYY